MIARVSLHSDDGIRPPSELRSKNNDRKYTVRSPNELGIVPVKQFLCKFRSRTMVSPPRDDGIGPVRLFLFIAKYRMNLLIFPKVLGREPEKQFEFKLIVIIFVQSPKLDGICPNNLLLWTCIVFRLNSCPIEVGRLPTRFRLNRFNRVICEFASQITPVQELLGQTGLFGTPLVHFQPFVKAVFADKAAAKSHKASVSGS